MRKYVGEWLLRHPGARNVFSNIGWLLFDKVIRLGVGVLVTIWVARYLGPEQFGILSYALAFVGLFSAVATLGLDGIVIRNLVKYPTEAAGLLGTSFLLKLVSGIACWLAAGMLIYLLKPGDVPARTAVLIAGLTLVFQSLDVFRFWFEAHVASRSVVISTNFAFALSSLVRGLLILREGPFLSFLWVYPVELLVGGIGTAWNYVRQSPITIRQWLLSRNQAISLLRDSWPLIFSGLAITIYMRIDQIMLGELLGNEAVGKYSVAVRVSEVWFFVPSALITSLYPTIIRSREHDRTIYLHRLRNLYGGLIWLASVVAVAVSFFSADLIGLLFGARYIDSGAVLAIHVWTAVFTFYGAAKSIFVQCENIQLFSFFCTFFGAICNILLNCILIPSHGISGAAVATLFSQVIGAIVLPLFSSRDRISVRLFFEGLFLPLVLLLQLWQKISISPESRKGT